MHAILFGICKIIVIPLYLLGYGVDAAKTAYHLGSYDYDDDFVKRNK